MQCKLYVIRVVVNDMKYYCFRAENSATESSLSAFYFREFSVETWSVESLICTNVKVRRKILYLSHMSTKCSWKKSPLPYFSLLPSYVDLFEMLGFENLTIISKLHLSEMNNVESGFTHQLVDFTPSWAVKYGLKENYKWLL